MTAPPATSNDLGEQIRRVKHWYHRIELAPGIVTPGTNDSPAVLERLRLPANMQGVRALDIGARDGFFSFEMERRGADVTALDYVPAETTGFATAARVLGSRVRYVRANVLDLPVDLGQFDLVLCLGVLYHLRDPIGALDAMRNVTRGRLILETEVLPPDPARSDARPLLAYTDGASLHGDPSNFFVPNPLAFRRLVEDADFIVDDLKVYTNRAIAFCHARPGPIGVKRAIGRSQHLPEAW